MHISRLKAQRAGNEILELAGQVETHVQTPSNMARLGVRLDAQSGFYEIYVSHIPDLGSLTARTSISVGVIVHLLRSALDNLTFQLAMSNTGGWIVNPRAIYWPICPKEADFQSACRSKLAEVSLRDREMIAQFQPYKGTNGRPDSWDGPYVHQLDLLQELSNSDKHRDFVFVSSLPNHFQLHPVVSPVFEAWNMWAQHNRNEYLESFRPVAMEVGARVFRPVPSSYSGQPNESVGQATAHLTLSDNRPLIPSLERLAKFVDKVLDAFEVPTL